MKVDKYHGTLALAEGITLHIHLISVTLFTGEDYETTVCEEDEEGEQFPRYLKRFTCESLGYAKARVEQMVKQELSQRALHHVVVERIS